MPAHAALLIALLFTDTGQAPAVPAAPAALPAPEGALVSVGDHRLFLACQGAAGPGPVVVFEAGGGGTSADWDLVRRELPPTVRTCAYDRAGSGRSERGPEPRTMRQEVFELHALLEAAQVKAPYVLVGQSIGGLLARRYVDAFPDEVVGMVLVEPSHESAVLGSGRYGGIVRLREKAAGRPVPEPRRTMAPAIPVDPQADYLAEEFQQIFLARQQRPRTLGQRPLVVLAAGKRPPAPPGVAADVWTGLRDERDQQVADLAELSSNSRFVRDAASGHHLHRDNPHLVARSIVDVIEAVRRGRDLRR
jgi:pimeloyl-ACP methyl ester carboxylesterase